MIIITMMIFFIIKLDDGATAWIEKSRQLESEVEWAKEVADRLERVNQSLLQENARLKSQFSSQEEDRNFLIKQLVAVKKVLYRNNNNIYIYTIPSYHHYCQSS